MEQWKSHPYWDGVEVSTKGRVRRDGTLVKPQVMSHGYLRATVAAYTRETIHKLVCETWLGERPDGYDIAHADGSRDNNALENLSYVTRSENRRQATQEHGRKVGAHAATKLHDRALRDEIRAQYPAMTFTELANKYNMNRCTVRDMLKGVTFKEDN